MASASVLQTFSKSGGASDALAGCRPGGFFILAPVRHRVKPGPVCEANGGRCITLRCFSAWGGRPRGSTLAVADGSHSTQLVTGDGESGFDSGKGA